MLAVRPLRRYERDAQTQHSTFQQLVRMVAAGGAGDTDEQHVDTLAPVFTG
jgi:hypothetical protein